MTNQCFHCTSNFNKSLSKLKKKYANIAIDLNNEFNGISFIDLFNWNYRIQDAGNYRLIKRRVANSHNQTGKSGGYRVYYIANLKEEKITFIAIYPKSNDMGKDNLDKKELRALIDEYKNEYSKEVLSEIDFTSI